MTYSLSPLALLHESHFDTRHKNGNRGKNAKTLLEYIDTSKHTAHSTQEKLGQNQQTTLRLSVNYTSFDVASCIHACQYDELHATNGDEIRLCTKID